MSALESICKSDEYAVLNFFLNSSSSKNYDIIPIITDVGNPFSVDLTLLNLKIGVEIPIEIKRADADFSDYFLNKGHKLYNSQINCAFTELFLDLYNRTHKQLENFSMNNPHIVKLSKQLSSKKKINIGDVHNDSDYRSLISLIYYFSKRVKRTIPGHLVVLFEEGQQYGVEEKIFDNGFNKVKWLKI